MQQWLGEEPSWLFPEVVWQRPACAEEGRRAVTRAKARQSRAEPGCGGADGGHMGTGRVTPVKLWGRVQLSTHIWAKAC